MHAIRAIVPRIDVSNRTNSNFFGELLYSTSEQKILRINTDITENNFEFSDYIGDFLFPVAFSNEM